jgi:hypothetical protein
MSAHENLTRHEPVKPGSDRVFGLVMTAFFALLGFWPLVHHRPIRWVFAAIGGAFLVLALLVPALLHPLNRLWTGLAVLLNRIVSPVVCGILFYVVVTPVAMVFRLTGKDPMRLKPDPDGKTYWIERVPPGPARESMRLQF